MQAQCSVSAVGVAYGSYNPLDSSAMTSTGTISIICTDNYHVSIGIGASPNSGDFNPRKMLNSTANALLNYNVYTSSSLATIWGDGTSGTSSVTSLVKKRTTHNALVYGRIPALQDVAIGSYSESLVVTINF